MFSFRDTIAATFLGVQPAAPDSSNSSVNEKKGKKKTHKKKTPKNCKRVIHIDAANAANLDVDAGMESTSEDSIASAEEEVDITNFGANNNPPTDAKVTSALIYQFESTQIGNDLFYIQLS